MKHYNNYWKTLTLVIFFSFIFQKPLYASRLPSAKRECSLCHITWLNDFKRDDVTPLIKYEPLPMEKTGQQDVVSTERMCFSCHDGYIMDSRFLWKNKKHTHPVGVIPSNKVQLPLIEGKEVFPLNMDGKVYCGTCHSAHGVDWNQKKTPIFMRMDNTDSAMCMLCHKNRTTGTKKGNHPVNKLLDDAPEGLLNAGSKFGDKNKVICQSCHRVHGASLNMLLVKNNNKSELCTSCHKAKREITGTKHDMGIMAASSTNMQGKTVAEKGICSACHIPHNAKSGRLWAREDSSDTSDRISSYCLSCHSDKGLAHKKTLNQFSHPLNVPVSKVGIVASTNKWSSRFDNIRGLPDYIKMPLFNEQGMPSKKGGNVTCATCHDPHVWSHNKIDNTKSDLSKVEGNGSSSFLRIPYDETNLLCINCHRKNSVVDLSKHNLLITSVDSKNIKGDIVTNSGTCSACHIPHNGNANYMWAREIDTQSAGVEKMCKSCHSKGNIADKKLTGKHSHPVQVSIDLISKDAQPHLPLFDDKGKRVINHGNVDCASCHNSHQWQAGKPNGTRGSNNKVEGNASNSFLRIAANHNSGLCRECHKGKFTVFGTDHDFRVTVPDIKNNQSQTLEQSGVCGQCHTPHNATLPSRLWARKPAEVNDIMASMCLSCHADKSIVKTKVPPNKLHPKRLVSVNETRNFDNRDRNIIPPVFGLEGKPSSIGNISCPTCHNPHQWKPDKAEKGIGKNLEGNVLSSFLRHKYTEYFLCSDCHGEDSIFRYKYYHWDNSRKIHHLYKP